MVVAPGIGPFCPNEACEVVDGAALYDRATKQRIAPDPLAVSAVAWGAKPSRFQAGALVNAAVEWAAARRAFLEAASTMSVDDMVKRGALAPHVTRMGAAEVSLAAAVKAFRDTYG